MPWQSPVFKSVLELSAFHVVAIESTNQDGKVYVAICALSLAVACGRCYLFEVDVTYERCLREHSASTLKESLWLPDPHCAVAEMR